ncbi:hypothetical protein LJK87_42865 [Paenibacillus sp. P25]|nr:hypothetical protein LJK87_42865 [Paenibacillus sp. P25]
MELSFDISSLLVLAGLAGLAAGVWCLLPLPRAIPAQSAAKEHCLPLPPPSARMRRRPVSPFRRKRPSPADSAHSEDEPSLAYGVNRSLEP